MDAQYWQDRWTEGRTGWHQAQPTPLLLKHWPTLDLPPNSRVIAQQAVAYQLVRR